MTFDEAVEMGILVAGRRLAIELTDGTRILGRVRAWTETELVIAQLTGGLAAPYWSTIASMQDLDV